MICGIIPNGTAVGFALPRIEFRLLHTEVFAHTTKLARDKSSFNVEYSRSSSYYQISISYFRGSVTRWGPRDPITKTYKEADWLKQVLYLQKHNVEISGRRVRQLATRTID